MRSTPVCWAARAAAVVAVSAGAVVAGCGDDDPDARTSAPTPETEAPTPPGEHEPPDVGPPDSGGPPPVRVVAADRSFDLDPYTFCYGDVCADGIPPADPTDVGDTERLAVEFPLPGWSFTATFQPAGDDCGRQQTVPLERQEDGTHFLAPAGKAGTYDVTLFGRGDGDVVVEVRWTTPSDGPLPAPEARLALLADHDGEVDSYGVELEVSQLATTPTDATSSPTFPL